MKKRYLYVLSSIIACALTLVCVLLAFNVNNNLRASTPDTVTEPPPGLTLQSVLILKNETISPYEFLRGSVEGYTVSFKVPVDTRISGKREIQLEITGVNDNRVYSPTALLYILEPARIVEREAGIRPNDVSTMDFISNESILHSESDYSLRFVTDLNNLNLHQVNWHEILLNFNGTEFASTLKLIDTTPPSSVPENVVSHVGQVVEAGDFVSNIDDVSPVAVFFKEGYEPDLFLAGEQLIAVILEDAYGNRSESRSLLTIRANAHPPVILGTRDLNVLLGGSVMYRQGVSAEDSFGNPISFTIENNVDINTPGVYSASYTAVDSDGNQATQTVSVTVSEIVAEDLESMVQTVIDSIIRDDMTQREMARAIFDWVGRNISYVSDAPKNSVLEGAYRALSYRSGDCFTFYAIAEVLLTRAGVPNIGIERIEGTFARHYWSLVNPDGEGWHHFDTTPIQVRRLDRFMFTESTAREYTTIINTELRTRDYYTYDYESLTVEVMP